MFVFFHVRAARRYFILLEAVDGESQVYLRVRRCAVGGATGGLGWRNFRFEFRICSAS